MKSSKEKWVTDRVIFVTWSIYVDTFCLYWEKEGNKTSKPMHRVWKSLGCGVKKKKRDFSPVDPHGAPEPAGELSLIAVPTGGFVACRGLRKQRCTISNVECMSLILWGKISDIFCEMRKFLKKSEPTLVCNRHTTPEEIEAHPSTAACPWTRLWGPCWCSAPGERARGSSYGAGPPAGHKIIKCI